MLTFGPPELHEAYGRLRFQLIGLSWTGELRSGAPIKSISSSTCGGPLPAQSTKRPSCSAAAQIFRRTPALFQLPYVESSISLLFSPFERSDLGISRPLRPSTSHSDQLPRSWQIASIATSLPRCSPSHELSGTSPSASDKPRCVRKLGSSSRQRDIRATSFYATRIEAFPIYRIIHRVDQRS